MRFQVAFRQWKSLARTVGNQRGMALLVDNPKFSWLKQLGIHPENPGGYAGHWFGG